MLTAFTIPASAEKRTIYVRLVTGQVVPVTVDVPPGTPLDDIQLPGTPVPPGTPSKPKEPATSPPPTTTAPPPTSHGGSQAAERHGQEDAQEDEGAQAQEEAERHRRP